MKMLNGLLAFLLVMGVVGPVSAMEAEELYNKKCAMCHGKDGQGNAGMAKAKKVDIAGYDLVDEATQLKEDEELIAATTNGVGKDMPAYKGKITDDEILSLVDYIRSLAPQEEEPVEDKIEE